MAKQSKPNTFSGGMVTDLDPAYQPKESYFTGLNVRVITNGDSSYSLENIQGPKSVYDLNTVTNEVGDTTFLSGTNRYIIHGAVVVDDYVITVEGQADSTNKNWKIRKYLIDSSGSVSNAGGINSSLWQGVGLFSDDAGRIEMESIAETENTHRVYGTDGITALKSINVKDSNIGASQVSDFLAFKPNLMKAVELDEYNETGGGLKYGSYSYVYRVGSTNQSNYTEWSNISRPINIVKNSLQSEWSLGIDGATSSDVSTVSLSLKILNLSTNYDNIQVARIHYVSKNISTIAIIETGFISSSTYEFIHSGFETETIVTGGIASAIISNKTWSTCKSLASKDNRLFAGNLTSTLLDLDSEIEGFGKLKAYKATIDGSDWSTTSNLSPHSGEFNPERHHNGTAGWSWSRDPSSDRSKYKFINSNFGSTTNPVYILGAETEGYSSGDDGFRMTFTTKAYLLDDDYEAIPSGATSLNAALNTGEEDPRFLYSIDSSNNSEDWAGGKAGPHNPKWDNTYRGFKRGECYRFGIVFYDLLGVPGFTYHLGDIKMPDALDGNNKVLNDVGDGVVDGYNGYGYEGGDLLGVDCWVPYHLASIVDEKKPAIAQALIPRIDVRLPTSIKDKISGWKIVRAEIQEDDRTIITQGLISLSEKHHQTQGEDNDLRNKTHCHGVPYGVSTFDSGYQDSTGIRIEDEFYLLESPDVTLGGKSYNFGTGFSVRTLYPMGMNNAQHNTNLTLNFNGTFQKPTPEDTDTNGGVQVIKYMPEHGILNAVGRSYHQSVSNGLDLYRQTTALYFGKSIDSGEEVSTTNSNGSSTYIHKMPVYSNSQHSLASGNLHIGEYDEYSRSYYSGDAVRSIFMSTKGSGGSIPKLNYFHKTLVSTTIGSYGDSYNNGWIYNTRQWLSYKWMGEVVRNTTGGFEQYGGTSESSIVNTRFYDCSDYVDKETESSLIVGGDTYIDFYTYMNGIHTDRGAQQYLYGSVAPVESSINIALRQGTYLGSSSLATSNMLDSTTYNSAYSQENNLIGSVVKPTGWESNNVFKSKIAASNVKLLGEPQDAWSIFPSNEFIELDLSSGALTSLVNYKDKLYAIQESGVSLLSVNPRALISGEGAAADIQIVSGTGAVIERYDYLSTQYGCQNYNEKLVSPTGFYFFDSLNSEVIKIGDEGFIPLSLSNSYKGYITSITKNKAIANSVNGNLGSLTEGVFSGYDPEFREIHYTVVDDNNSKSSFVISDLDGKLISETKLRIEDHINQVFYKKYITYQNRLLAVAHETTENSNDGFHLFNAGVYQSYNFGVVINDEPTSNKVFDSSEILGSSTLDQSYSEMAFSSHEVSDSSSTTSFVGFTNEVNREGIVRVPLRGEGYRLRGNWLKYTISYNQETSEASINDFTDKKFNIFAINTRYRNSR